MSRYSSYSGYRYVHTGWIERVPKHWDFKPIRSSYTLRNGYPFDSNLFTSEGRPSNRLIRIRDLSATEATTFTDELCPVSARVSDGDVLVGMDGEFNVVRWQGGAAKLNQRVCALNGETEDRTAFLCYLLPTPLKVINDKTYATTVKHLSSDEVLAEKVPVPPSLELRKIVAHLDRETAHIDALIEKKTRFIELLREKRQALITQAVTRGLDPGVPVKDSGVEWVGQVPAHWTVVQLRHVAQLGSGHTPNREHSEYWENCTIPWFTLADVWQIRREKRKYVKETEEKVSELGITNSAAVVHRAGSVILSRTASVGFPAIMGCDMATSQDFAVWSCGERLSNEFLYFVLLGMHEEFARVRMGSTHKTIYMPDIEAFRIALPPLSQQQEIVEYLEERLSKNDAIVAATERSIGLLRERRSALITAAVTGQIDVRADQPAAEALEPA